LAALVSNTIREGCVGETIASALIADAAFAAALDGDLAVEAAVDREDLRSFGRLGRGNQPQPRRHRS
jgi:hypothetical protein